MLFPAYDACDIVRFKCYQLLEYFSEHSSFCWYLFSIFLWHAVNCWFAYMCMCLAQQIEETYFQGRHCEFFSSVLFPELSSLLCG